MPTSKNLHDDLIAGNAAAAHYVNQRKCRNICAASASSEKIKFTEWGSKKALRRNFNE